MHEPCKESKNNHKSNATVCLYSLPFELFSDAYRVTPLAETRQLLPAFHTVDAFLQNSFLTLHADIVSSIFTLTDLQ